MCGRRMQNMIDSTFGEMLRDNRNDVCICQSDDTTREWSPLCPMHGDAAHGLT